MKIPSIRVRNALFLLLVLVSTGSLLVAGIARAQAPARGATQAPGRGAAPPPARGGAAAAARPMVQGNLLQVMRGILFPNSNIIFAVQSTDPESFKRDADPSVSVNPLTGMYGGWQAVENSGIAMAEAANLLIVPGRTCANGKPVPVQAADWNMFVADLRKAGMAVAKAGQSKNKDAISDAADEVATACQDCHDVYREKSPAQGGLAGRCTK